MVGEIGDVRVVKGSSSFAQQFNGMRVGRLYLVNEYESVCSSCVGLYV